MNKIDAAIELFELYKNGQKIDVLKILAHKDTILEALQAMKDKERIAEQPDTIHNDDCVKQTIQDKGVMEALDKLVSEKMCGDQLDQTEVLDCYHRVKTALAAKQPDMERLKRIEKALVVAHEDHKTYYAGSKQANKTAQALSDIRAMMEERDGRDRKNS